MELKCDKCGFSKNIPDEKVPKDVQQARCPQCSNSVPIKRSIQADSSQEVRSDRKFVSPAHNKPARRTIDSRSYVFCAVSFVLGIAVGAIGVMVNSTTSTAAIVEKPVVSENITKSENRVQAVPQVEEGHEFERVVAIKKLEFYDENTDADPEQDAGKIYVIFGDNTNERVKPPDGLVMRYSCKIYHYNRGEVGSLITSDSGDLISDGGYSSFMIDLSNINSEVKILSDVTVELPNGQILRGKATDRFNPQSY